MGGGIIISDDDTGGIYFSRCTCKHAILPYCLQRMSAVCFEQWSHERPATALHAVFSATEETLEDACLALRLCLSLARDIFRLHERY